MKKSRFWMLLMALVCLLAFGVTASADEKRTIVSDGAVSNSSDATGQRGSAARSRTTGTFSGNFGDQLTGNSRKIYDTLCAADMKLYTVDSEQWVEVALPTPYVFTTTAESMASGAFKQEASYLAAKAELSKDAQKAIDAFRNDRSDVYWIGSIQYSWSFSYGGTGTCQISLRTLNFQARAYYDEILEETSLVNSALAAADAAIRERRGDSSRYETVKAIHDYVAELVTYGHAGAGIMYEHTITGGLLSKYNHEGVCESYAKIVKILCDRFSVPCALIIGGSKVNTDGTLNADHMWNVVQMEDGKWYLLDATWDDQSIGIQREYFLAGSNSIGFNGKTIAQDHMMMSTLSGVDYEPFVMPTLATEAYSQEDQIPLTGITLNAGAVSLAHGNSQTLTVSYAPANTTYQQEVTWISSDSDIAQVDSQGKITAGTKAGTATITAVSKAESTIQATCTVQVTHIEGSWVQTKAPTCKDTGSRVLKCSVCEASLRTETIPADTTNHTAGEWTTVKAATCTEEGSKQKTCKVCGKVVETQSIEATGHTAGEWTTVKAATCTEAGSQQKTCKVCGKVVETQSIEATGHTVGEWTMVKAATCTETGSKQKTCKVCEKVVETQTIEATGHTAGTAVTVKAATCTQKGLMQTKCTTCGTVLSQKEIALAAHKYGSWKTTKAATIFATGTKKRTCTVCGKTESKTIAKKSASVKLNVSTLMLQVKKSTTALTIKKKTSGDSVKKWTSSKPAVAAVNSRTGKITAKKTGTTVITVTMKSGAVAKCTVKVQKNPVKTTKLTLNKKKVTLAKGKSLTLQVTRNPLTANDKLTWKSSNAKIVKVNSKGKIQALKKGKATITVKAASGKKATCTVTVK
ncbi:MAG: Ig-like domain-containing protein [Eubacteriales bacterium]|nr:Ig-like domain-containing protein [Eubacteriales bacterium]